MPQHNTPERRAMLAARAEAQRERTPGYTVVPRKAPGATFQEPPRKIDVTELPNRMLRKFWRYTPEPKTLEQWVTSNLTALRLMAAEAAI